MKKTRSYRRRQLVIYPVLQWTMVGALALVAGISSIVTSSFIRFFQSTDSYEVSRHAILIMTSISILLVSGWLILAIYFTNRVFGPIFRLHKEVNAFRAGTGTRPIILRDGDHFKTLISDFNQLMDDCIRKEDIGK